MEFKDKVVDRYEEERAELKKEGFVGWVKKPSNWVLAGLVAVVGLLVAKVFFGVVFGVFGV